MHKLKRKFSFSRKKDLSTEDAGTEEEEWQGDEMKVRNGTCNFLLQYIGCMVVADSKGIDVCEEATKKLVEKNPGPYKTVIFQVRGEHLKTVDEENSALLIDQLVERVSFCSPNRLDPKGFAYISRDSVAKQWVCHAYFSLRDKGERVSYAVGYAFNICMELRMMRETSRESGFKRSQSFRTTSMTDRRTDPQSTMVAENPVPLKKIGKLQSIERPRPPEQLKRQSSLISLNNVEELEAVKGERTKVNQSKLFKRQMSMKVEELSSILDRLNATEEKQRKKRGGHYRGDDSELFADIDNKAPQNGSNNVPAAKDTTTEPSENTTDPPRPITQSNPWTKKPPPARTSAAERKIEADEWLLAVAKKASMLRKETGSVPLKSDIIKRVQMSQVQSHSVDGGKAKDKGTASTGSMGGSVDKGAQEKKSPREAQEDPFDTGWAEKIANKGKNPFKTRSATIAS